MPTSVLTSPETNEFSKRLPISTQEEGFRAPLQQRIGQEKAAETHRYSRGMPASAATSPETAVPRTLLRAHGPEPPSAKDGA